MGARRGRLEGVALLDHQQVSGPDRPGVELRAVGGGADRGDVGAGPEPGGVGKRRRGVGAEADHVGAVAGLLESVNRPGSEVGSQRPGVVGIAAGDTNLGEVAHARVSLEVAAALDAGAEDGQHLGVGPAQDPGRDRRRGAGPGGGDVRPIHHRQRRAGGGVEECDQRLVGGQPPVVVVGKDGDELGLQHAIQVTRHRSQQAVGAEGGDARWNRSLAGAQRDECPGQSVDQLVEVEEAPYLRLGDEKR